MQFSRPNSLYRHATVSYANDKNWRGRDDWTKGGLLDEMRDMGMSWSDHFDKYAGTIDRYLDSRNSGGGGGGGGRDRDPEPEPEPAHKGIEREPREDRGGLGGVDIGKAIREGINTAYTDALDELKQMGKQHRKQVRQTYDRARGYLPHLMQQRLQPQTQDVLNNLAERGVIDSSMAQTALAQAAQGSMGDILGLQAQLAQQEAQALGGASGDIFDQLAAMTGQGAQMEAQGNIREYELLAQLLPTLLQYGV